MGKIKRMAEEMGYFEMDNEEKTQFAKEFNEGTLKDIPEEFQNNKE